MPLPKNKPESISTPSWVWLVFGLLLFFGKGGLAGVNGPLAKFNSAQPYLIYYGNWTASQVTYARTNYQLVILHPSSNITSNQIAAIRSGKDGILGTADDVVVLAYLSIGEDAQNGAPVAGDRMGPRVDPRAADSDPLSGITNALGVASAGGTNYASYYLNSRSNQTGKPDQNASFGSYYVNAGAPAWWSMLKGMAKATNGQSGLDEILTAKFGNALNCDGLFMDTVDTAAPNTWGTPYEWTAPGMQMLIQRIHTNYPSKLLLANRGLFFFDPNQKTYTFTIRPYVDLVMWESYFSDSSTNPISLYFLDNKFQFAAKLNAEAGRPDGFNLLVVDYDHTPPQSQLVINQDYAECMNTQGWALYRTNPYLDKALNNFAAVWSATNLDTQPPAWDSTAGSSSNAPPVRVGVQAVVAGAGSATVYWDVARDQTDPVRYNIYYSIGGTVNVATATKLSHVVPEIPANYNYPTGTGPGVYPYCYTVTGLQDGMTYAFAVRAEDSCSPAHEDTNLVSITITVGTNGLSTYKTITIDGAFADWTNIPWAYQGSADGNPVNYLQVQFANDTTNLYGHVKLASAYGLFSDYYSHLFFDTDLDAQTGYSVLGASFGSEMMIETGYGYDQRNGSFNAGSVSGLGWAVAPSVSTNEFEFKMSLTALYPDNRKVFGTNAMRILLQDNRGPETAVATGIKYQISPPQAAPLFMTQSNNAIYLNWTGPGTLQCSPSLSAPVWTAVSTATNPYGCSAGSGQQFFRLAQ